MNRAVYTVLVKIVEDTASRLVLRESPVGLTVMMSLFAVGTIWLLLRDFAAASWGERLLLLFLAPGMAVLAYFTATWVSVRFERAQGVIEIERQRLFGRIEERYPLAELVKARRDARDDTEGLTYRLLLVFSDAYLEALDAEVRDRLVRARRRGFRQARPNEVPLTHYFTGFGDQALIADRINAWCFATAAPVGSSVPP